MSESVMVLSTQKAARRAQIEMRIEMHRDAAAGSLLEVGRQLCAAKDEGVVPHGEWTAWVAQHAAMSERVAQKWMQAARELPPGSPLERLGIAKIQSLMMIESGEREEFAERIGADKLSSREVDAAVKAARAERDEALRVLAEKKRAFSEKAAQCKDQARLLREADKRIVDIESKLREKEREKAALVTDVRKQVEAEQSREMHRLAVAVKSAEIDKQRAELQLDGTREALAVAQDKARQLLRELEQEKAQKLMPDPAQVLEIHKLQETLAKKEREIDRLSDELDAAQTAAMRGGMSGNADRPSPSTVILSSIGALMAQAGRAPGELARMQGMLDAETREILCGQARLVGQWAMQILAACGEGETHV